MALGVSGSLVGFFGTHVVAGEVVEIPRSPAKPPSTGPDKGDIPLNPGRHFVSFEGKCDGGKTIAASTGTTRGSCRVAWGFGTGLRQYPIHVHCTDGGNWAVANCINGSCSRGGRGTCSVR